MGNSAPRVRRNVVEAAATGGAPKVRPKRPGEKAADERGVVTVKVVMPKKEAERLAARLKEQRARERKTRMAELKNVLRAGTGGSAVVSPARSRMQTLALIQER